MKEAEEGTWEFMGIDESNALSENLPTDLNWVSKDVASKAQNLMQQFKESSPYSLEWCQAIIPNNKRGERYNKRIERIFENNLLDIQKKLEAAEVVRQKIIRAIRMGDSRELEGFWMSENQDPLMFFLEHVTQTVPKIFKLKDPLFHFTTLQNTAGDKVDKINGAFFEKLSYSRNIKHHANYDYLHEDGREIFPLNLRERFMGAFSFSKEKVMLIDEKRMQRELNRIMFHIETLDDMLTLIQEKREAEERAVHDKLTPVLNREGVNREMIVTLSRAKRQKQCFSTILIDIDHFKLINDQYGHAAWDKVLVQLSELLMGTVRPGDIVGRWGGEEFIVVLSHDNEEDGSDIAERIRESVEKMFVEIDNHPIRFTCSIWVETASHETILSKSKTDKSFFQDMIAAADVRLYEWKRLWRNRVIDSLRRINGNILTTNSIVPSKHVTDPQNLN